VINVGDRKMAPSGLRLQGRRDFDFGDELGEGKHLMARR
jgi:hypothetical protein